MGRIHLDETVVNRLVQGQFGILPSVDHRVLPRQAKMYLKQLEKYNKPYKYVELEGAGHFSSTLFYNHQLDLYTAITEFPANDCGPNGISENLSASNTDQ
jgi:hypothetical protein